MKTRKYSLYVACITLHSLGTVVIFGAFIIVNAIGLSQYSFCFNECFNSTMRPVNIAMIVIGVAAFITTVVYFITIPSKINGGCGNRGYGQTAFSTNGTIIAPQNMQYQPNFNFQQAQNMPPSYNNYQQNGLNNNFR